MDWGTYDIVDKVAANSVGLTGNFCCPLGYGTGGFDCPLGTDLTKQCCKRNGFMDYTKVDKISCTIPPVCQVTPTIPPAPCASNMVNGSCTKLNTGLGDISTTQIGFIQSVFGIVLSISGGIAILLIIVSGYRMLASQGNPEALKGAKEQLTAAIVGLLFIIFALVILEIIGVNILQIPGFGSGPLAQPPNAHLGGK
ncbi:MAG: pilin [Patescibacteria group bacterium]|nr:pilin [Patescibacteria group bacterium]